MGCGAQGAKKLEEAEILSTQLRSSLKKQELELQRLEAHEAANSKERTRLRQELDEARSEDALAKALAEIRSLREKVASSEAAASAEATRSSRLDGRCSVLEVESRALRDELTAASSAHFQSQEASDNLHQQLTARKQELTQLHVQLQSLSDEASDLQAQRDYALSELKAANQVAEALKATSTALDGKRPRKPRKSRPAAEPEGSQGACSDTDQGLAITAPDLKIVEPVEPESRSSEGSALAVPMPEVPWADSPLQASPQAFAFEREGKLSLENAGGAAPSSGMQEAAKEMPKIYTDPNAKVFQFDFSVFDFLKHEALQTPPESPLEVLPVEVSDKWSDARWSTRV